MPEPNPAPSPGNRPGYAWLILVAAVTMQLCLGATYAWSQFSTPVRQLLGITTAQAKLPYTFFYIFFPATMVFGGEILHRLGPRRCTLAGAVLFPAGWAMAWLWGQSLVMLVLGLGVVAGVGAGLAYLVPITVCVRWFPRRKGLVTGLAVAGFGGSAAIVSMLGNHLIESAGLGVLTVFGIFAGLFLLGIGFAAVVMRNPPWFDERAERETPVSRRQILTSRGFVVLFVSITLALAAGFTVNANLRQLLPGLERARPSSMATAVALFALFNAVGRLVWGFVHDHAGGRRSIILNQSLQGVVIVTAPLWLGGVASLYVLAIAVGFNYGGTLVNMASEVGRLWGAARLGRVYGWMAVVNIVASPAPPIAAWSRDVLGSWTVSLYVAGALVLAGAVVLGLGLPGKVYD